MYVIVAISREGMNVLTQKTSNWKQNEIVYGEDNCDACLSSLLWGPCKFVNLLMAPTCIFTDCTLVACQKKVCQRLMLGANIRI